MSARSSQSAACAWIRATDHARGWRADGAVPQATKRAPSAQAKEAEIPRVIVIASPSERDDGAMMLSERVTVADLDSEHFASQLIDRLRWAVTDAHQAEQP